MSDRYDSSPKDVQSEFFRIADLLLVKSHKALLMTLSILFMDGS